jgi:phospholipid/cholesterol/gamma-HCH transport system substrate-binding protein
MENRAYAFAVGLFTLLLGAGVVLAALWFSRNTESREIYEIESRYPVTGLNPQAPVRFRGVEVGRVESIEFSREDPRKILVAVSVRSDTPVTRGTYAQLGSQGVTGLSYVLLDDDGDKPQPLTPGESAQTRIQVRPSYLDEITVAGKTLVTGADDVARRLNALLSEGNQAQLIKTLASLESATIAVARVAGKLDPAVRDLPAVSADARKALARADALLVSMNKLTEELSRRVDTLDQVSKSAEQVGGAAQSLSGAAVGDTLPRIHSLLEELARNSRAFDRLLTELNEQPSSLVFGRPAVAPGPGEAGFSAPRK